MDKLFRLCPPIIFFLIIIITGISFAEEKGEIKGVPKDAIMTKNIDKVWIIEIKKLSELDVERYKNQNPKDIVMELDIQRI